MGEKAGRGSWMPGVFPVNIMTNGPDYQMTSLFSLF